MYIPANAYKRMDMENITEPSLSLPLSPKVTETVLFSTLFEEKREKRGL